MILLFIPTVFFSIDFIYFVLHGQRISGSLRLIFEIITVVVFPLLFYFLLFFIPDFEMTDEFVSLKSNIAIHISFVLFIPCIIGYFSSNYRSHIYSELRESTLNLCIVFAIILNIALFILITCKIGPILPIAGNLPIIITFGTTLIQNLRRQIESI